VLCGSVSSYARPDDTDAGADLRDAVFKRITLRGYIVSDYYPRRLNPIRAQLAALLQAKQLRVVVSEFEGLMTVYDRGSPYIGSGVVRISEG
jgi:NADPH-dependent curcumin reductase CurA